ncbi:AAA family ATPase [Novosphingobium album (ex Liu et al. 2023)]|uniref:AAA family ATPase n=1 Tax=Novosphingobium album (ex Liu et al. 2023) TaxID=3031130 RepID=UPI0023B079F1|nr:ATP-binding protein [Novosphingobium album (ex Liu et al. 2023)]
MTKDDRSDLPSRPLLERDVPLAALGRVLDSARKGRGGTVFVREEAGIGKSSLLRTFAQKCGPVLLLWGVCDAFATAQVLGPLFDMADAFDEHLRNLLSKRAAANVLFTALLAMVRRARASVVMVVEDAP